MKAQKLKELLDTGYIVAFYKGYKSNDYIGIGSPYVGALIKLDSVTLKLSYALDTWHKGESSLDNPDLIDANEKLKAIIITGEIQDIISGDDDPVKNCIPVFYEKNGDILQTFCAELGWPHTTITGELMYENSHYASGKEAAEKSYGPEEYYNRNLEDFDYRIKDFQEKIESQKKWKQEAIDRRAKLKEYLGL